MSAQGVLHVHSAPPALCPHIEWAVAGILGVPVDLPWVSQPAAPGTLRAELTWEGRPRHGRSGHLRAGRLEPAALRDHRRRQRRLRRGPAQLHADTRHLHGGDRR